MCKEGLDKCVVTAVMYNYFEAKTAVKVEIGLSERFEVTVGVHQGSVLSPLLYYCNTGNHKDCLL